MALPGTITPIKVVISKKIGNKWKLIKYSSVRHKGDLLFWTRFSNCIRRLKFDGKTKYKFWITYTDNPKNCNGGVYTNKAEMLVAWEACINNDLVIVLWNDLERKKFPIRADYSILEQFVVLGSNQSLPS